MRYSLCHYIEDDRRRPLLKSVKFLFLIRRGLDLGIHTPLIQTIGQWSLISKENKPLTTYYSGVIVNIRSIKVDFVGSFRFESVGLLINWVRFNLTQKSFKQSESRFPQAKSQRLTLQRLKRRLLSL